MHIESSDFLFGEYSIKLVLNNYLLIYSNVQRIVCYRNNNNK